MYIWPILKKKSSHEFIQSGNKINVGEGFATQPPNGAAHQDPACFRIENPSLTG